MKEIINKKNRNRIRLCLLLCIAAMYACSDSDTIFKNEDAPVQTRGLVFSDIFTSITNPSLIDNWESQSTILLSSGELVASPWNAGAAIATNVEFATDIKKEDGWKMLFHTFKDLNTDAGSNYMFFYNRLTGYMKVFYYREANNTGNNGGMWQLKTMNGESSTLFNLNSYFALPNNTKNDDSSVTISNISQGPVAGFTKGWNGFELELPYSTDYKDIYFALITYNKNIVSYSFMGNSQTDIEGTLTKFGNSTTGLINTISSLSGQGAKSLVNKMKTKVDNNQASDMTGVVNAKLGPKIVNLLSGIGSKNYASLISKGLKFIFGSTTTVDQTSIKLTANSKISLTGTSENPSFSDIPILGLLNLYDIMNGNITADKSNPFTRQIVLSQPDNQSSKSEYLGVWTLEKEPVLTIGRYGIIYGGYIFSNSAYKVQLRAPVLFKTDFSVSINPFLNQYITSQSFKIDIVTCEQMKGNAYRPIENIRYPSEMIKSDIIYQDKDILLSEQIISTSKTSTISFNKPNDNIVHTYWYDWGETPTGQELLIVSGTIYYNYNNKKHEISFSRVYKPKIIYDSKYQAPVINRPDAYIVKPSDITDYKR